MTRLGSFVSTGAEQTEELATQLGRTLQVGDVLVLTGPLGAGKTTLTRGLAAGAGITEPITSPTYAIAFVHEHPSGGPNFVHVDAYRLTGLDDLETVDLDPQLPKSITVMEWGSNYVESLTDGWLEVTLERDAGSGQDEANQNEAGEDKRAISARAYGQVRSELLDQWREIFGQDR